MLRLHQNSKLHTFANGRPQPPNSTRSIRGHPKWTDCVFLTKMSKNSTHHVIENISLMDVNCNQGFELGSFVLGKLRCCHTDELVEHVQELLIHCRHGLYEKNKDIRKRKIYRLAVECVERL